MSDALSPRGLAHLLAVIEWPDVDHERYDVTEVLGRGGMSTVFRAHDRILGRDVALKVMSSSPYMQGISARLSEEQRTMAMLEHPGVVPIYDAGTTRDGRPYYVMRLVRGETLEQLVQRGDAECWHAGLRAFERVCETVAFAHAERVLHLDLKPTNVMVGPYGEVFVLDWGLARSGPFSASVERAGTPGFMAPEQESCSGALVDGRADVFALGALLGWMLDATQPGARGRNGKPWRAIAARACAPSPELRYPDPLALLEDVRRLEAGEPVSAYVESWLERLTRVMRRHWTLSMLVLVYVVVRVLLLFLAR